MTLGLTTGMTAEGALPGCRLSSRGVTSVLGDQSRYMGQKDKSTSVGGLADDILVARAGAGDRLAASELIVRYSDQVMAVSYRMLGDRTAAEDATQETFLKLWKSASTWTPGAAKFSTWLYRVTSNVCLDRLRVRGREATGDDLPEMVDDRPAADEMIEAADRSEVVRGAIDGLPERQRLAIVLRHYEDLSNIETAEVMGVSVEAVESLLGRAKRSLKETLLSRKAELLEIGG